MTPDLFTSAPAPRPVALDTAAHFEAHLATLRRRIDDAALLADQAHAAYLACGDEADCARLDDARRWHIAVYRTWVRALLDFTGDADDLVHAASAERLRAWDLAA